jgi:hypothetical protein
MEESQDIATEMGSTERTGSAPIEVASVATAGNGTVAGVWIAPVAPVPSRIDEEHARAGSGFEVGRSPETPAGPLHSRRPKKARSFRRSCRACTSDRIAEIENLCSMGTASTVVGRRFGVSGDSVRRHWNSHVDGERKARLIGRHVFNEPVEVADQFEVLKSNERSRWLARLSLQRSDLTALTKHADARVAVMAHRTLLTLAEITGKHLDLLNIGPSSVTTNNVLNLGGSNDVDVMALKSLLEAALRPFAGAWPAVMRALSAPMAMPASSEQ